MSMERPSVEKPLLGVRIMVTRPADPKDPLSAELRRSGAEVVLQPAIRIEPPDDWRPVDKALQQLEQFDWIVFSSADGVRFFFDRLKALTGGCDKFSHPRIAAIGPGTAEELQHYGLDVSLIPQQFRAESLADALTGDARGRRFLLARASRGREVLAERLTAAGGIVEQIVVYSSVDVDKPEPAVLDDLRNGRIDWVTVTSSAIASSLVRLFGDDLHRAKLASISPITSHTLKSLGFVPTVEAKEFTVSGLVAAIIAGQ